MEGRRNGLKQGATVKRLLLIFVFKAIFLKGEEKEILNNG